jgi:hypothetical protein
MRRQHQNASGGSAHKEDDYLPTLAARLDEVWRIQSVVQKRSPQLVLLNFVRSAAEQFLCLGTIVRRRDN